MIPEGSVNVFVGDSGLGKTPLLAQEGVCVAAGIPFLGQKTRRGVVLYADYENSEAGFALLLDKLREHLGLDAIPDTFRYLSQPDKNTLKAEMALWRGLYPDLPMLVICDSLRGFDPAAETKNENAARMIAEPEKWAHQFKCAFLLIHHLRKDNPKEEASPLIETDVMEWLIASAGARALVNQSMVRFGIDNESLGGSELVIKGHYKLRGGIGPLFLTRARDDDGEPIGYSRVSGLNLLDKDQQAVFTKLPDEFRFKDLEKTSGKNAKIVADWLRVWRCAEVVTVAGEQKQRRYHKVTAAVKSATGKVNAIIAHIEATFAVDVIFSPADLQNVNCEWSDQNISEALKTLKRHMNDGFLHDGKGKYQRTGREYLAAGSNFINNLNGEPFTSQQFAEAVHAKPADTNIDLVAHLFNLLLQCNVRGLEKFPDGRYRAKP